jgi:hypothetical protein
MVSGYSMSRTQNGIGWARKEHHRGLYTHQVPATQKIRDRLQQASNLWSASADLVSFGPLIREPRSKTVLDNSNLFGNCTTGYCILQSDLCGPDIYPCLPPRSCRDLYSICSNDLCCVGGTNACRQNWVAFERFTMLHRFCSADLQDRVVVFISNSTGFGCFFFIC